MVGSSSDEDDQEGGNNDDEDDQSKVENYARAGQVLLPRSKKPVPLPSRRVTTMMMRTTRVR